MIKINGPAPFARDFQNGTIDYRVYYTDLVQFVKGEITGLYQAQER